ncbi:MAG: helix-turn-helix domain-containing protein [Planctomycetota bacterium]
MRTANVMTLEEAAAYLRVPQNALKRYAARGYVPGRRIGETWRFLKAALDDWLRSQDSKARMLEQAGVFADDETLPALRASIYAKRGRPEVAQ